MSQLFGFGMIYLAVFLLQLVIDGRVHVSLKNSLRIHEENSKNSQYVLYRI